MCDHIYCSQWCHLPAKCSILGMVYNHPIFDQRAATIVLLLLAVLSVLAFAVAGVAIM